MRLAEAQAAIRQAILEKGTGAMAGLLTGGRDPLARFEIHRRHYRASLVKALADKFPATLWLIGGERFSDAADDFVRHQPPAAPCIAEYGENFPDFLRRRDALKPMPYASAVARADWFLGQVSVATDQLALDMAALAKLPPETLPDLRLLLQPGLRHMTSSWRIDELLTLYLNDDAPEHFVLATDETFLEIRGARGAFRFKRLDAGSFTFRRAVAAGKMIGVAAEEALQNDSRFDAGAALGALFAEGLVGDFQFAE